MPDNARSEGITLPSRTAPSSEFPSYEPVTASAEFANFMESMRQFQNLVSSSNPNDDIWRAATDHLTAINEMLGSHQAAEGRPPAGRALELPGMGNPLLPAWQISHAATDGTTLKGQFGRFYLGANKIVFGGVLPLLFDWGFAIALTAAGRPMSRTAYLNVDYRKPAPIDTDLIVHARVDRVDDRKTTLAAELIDTDGTVLAEAETLMIGLQAHHR
ncbi:MAG: PaaI family thioesterase [Actinomycetota bacterium]